MEISFIEKSESCILNLSSNITFEFIVMLKNTLNNLPKSKSIAFNLNNAEFICLEFLELIKDMADEKKVSLINLPSDIFAILNLTKYDNYANIYICEKDFEEGKSIIKNRRFSLV